MVSKSSLTDQRDVFQALINWVEFGNPPDRIIDPRLLVRGNQTPRVFYYQHSAVNWPTPASVRRHKTRLVAGDCIGRPLTTVGIMTLSPWLAGGINYHALYWARRCSQKWRAELRAESSTRTPRRANFPAYQSGLPRSVERPSKRGVI